MARSLGASVSDTQPSSVTNASANTGQPVLAGKVNYISGVRYNGALLDNNPHPNITITTVYPSANPEAGAWWSRWTAPGP